MRGLIWAAAGLVLAALAACDNGPSAVAKTDGATAASAQFTGARAGTASSAGSSGPGSAASPASSGAGADATLWSSTRTYAARANAERAFAQNGGEFGAADADAYIKLAHAFIEHPPKGALRYVRPNGDLMLYDAASNTFAVATKAGAPRTLFKPREGKAYWSQQMAIEKAGSGG